MTQNYSRDMRKTRPIQQILMKTLLVLTLLLAGTANEVWAVNKANYYIVNNKGNVAFKFNNVNDQLQVHVRARALFADDFRFYTSLTDAQTDASTGTEQAGALHEGDASVNGQTYYVRYSYVASPSLNLYECPGLDVSGSTWYQLRINPDKMRCLGYHDVNDIKIDAGATATFDDAFLWSFDAANDPYDIHIVNKQGSTDHAGYVLTADGVNNSCINQTYAQLKYAARNSDDQEASPMNLQSFFFTKYTKDGKDAIQIVGAYAGFVLNNEGFAVNQTFFNGVSGSTDKFCYYLATDNRPSEWSSDITALLWIHNKDQYGAAWDNRALITLARKITYHIVNAQGETVESVEVIVTNPTLNLPNRSRLERIGCNLSVKYYTDASCTMEVTDVQPGITDYYIPYTFDPVTLRNATGLIFSTEENPRWFNLQVNNNKRNITYDASSSKLLTNNSFTTDVQKNNNIAQWAFIGDPYSMKVINRADPTKAAYVADVTNGTIVYLRDYSTYKTSWVARAGRDNSSAFQLKPQGMGITARQGYWNAAGGSGAIQLYTGNTDDYVGTDNNLFVSIPPMEQTYTFYVINSEGHVAILNSVTAKAGTSPMVAFEQSKLKSSLIPDAKYKFYVRSQFDAVADATTAWTTNAGGNNDYTRGPLKDIVGYTGYTYTLKSGEAGMDLVHLPCGEADIFVTYEYDPQLSNIDLSGGTEYKVAVNSNPANMRFIGSESTDLSVSYANWADAYRGGTGEGNSFVFKFFGNDPYNVGIYSRYQNSNNGDHNNWASLYGRPYRTQGKNAMGGTGSGDWYFSINTGASDDVSMIRKWMLLSGTDDEHVRVTMPWSPWHGGIYSLGIYPTNNASKPVLYLTNDISEKGPNFTHFDADNEIFQTLIEPITPITIHVFNSSDEEIYTEVSKIRKYVTPKCIIVPAGGVTYYNGTTATGESQTENTWVAAGITDISIKGNFSATPYSVTYHVINKQGVEAIAIIKGSASTLTMPNEIKTPYITSDASYKFFDTKEHAAAYTLNGTTEGVITTFEQITDKDKNVYVGYQWDGTVPSNLPALNGSSWHQMIVKQNTEYIITSGTNNVSTASTATAGTTYPYLWSFFADDDPYDIHVSNMATNNAYNNGNTYSIGLADNYKAYDQTYGWYRTKMVGSDSFSMILVNSGHEGWYNVLLLSSDGVVGTVNYVRTLWCNTNQIIFTRIDANYSSTEPKRELQFNKIPLVYVNYHLTTHSGNKELTALQIASDYTSKSITLPNDLLRKYCAYTYYSDAGCTNSISTYDDVVANCTFNNGAYQVYVQYEAIPRGEPGGLPFDISTDYDHARWYRIKVVEGDAYAHLSESAQVVGVDGVYTKDYMYAFFGDPYELKVMNRAGGDGKYLGVPAGSALQEPIMPIANGTALNTWEILYDEVADGKFQLRVFGNAANPRYCGYYGGKASFLDTPITLQPDDLPQYTYTYNIVDNAGRIAIQGTATQDVGTPIRVDNLPAGIVSPYIADEEITGFLTSTYIGTTDGRDKFNLSSTITETPGNDASIYIRYTTDKLMSKWLHLRGARAFNIKVNSEYIFDSKAAGDEEGTLGHESTDANKTNRNHLWYLTGLDPYAVNIKNVESQRYFNFTTPSTLVLKKTVNAGSFFILMAGDGTNGGSVFTQVEFMAATGDNISSDHYHIGRNDGDATLIQNATAHAATIQTQVCANAVNVTYHIIDKAGHVLITVDGESQDLQVPIAWRSPLVSQYHFWKLTDFSINNNGTPADDSDDVYTLTASTELESPADVGSGGHIYVTYDVADEDMFAKVKTTVQDDNTTYSHVSAKDPDKAAPTYMIRYLNGESFNQEDEADGFLSPPSKAVYPYNNGDGGLFVYGPEQWANQEAKAASTRGRWLWYIESETCDPYHVKVASRQSNQDHFSYLRTYMPQGYGSIVTNVITGNPKVATGADDKHATRHVPTEYMILGTPGHGRFVTVDPVDDGTTNERRTVNSFEQYWKNRLTANELLKDANDPVTTEGRSVTTSSTQKAILEKGQDGDGLQTWHSYDFWANSHPWVNNGDASKTTGRKFEYEEHWFQTIDMGNGEFTLEEVQLSAALILLDQHGWEVARVVLPDNYEDPKRKDKYENLHKYNSPMVERYHYWKTGKKVFGYHKFEVEDYAIDPKTGGEYTTDELGVYDPDTKVGNLPDFNTQALVGTSGRDWYVTYDVKPEYANAYKGAATSGATQASAYLLKQGGHLAKTTDGVGINTETTDYDGTTNMQWLLRPNFNIDREMGYLYSDQEGHQDDARTKNETEADYLAAGKNGFDPYNVQIQSVAFDTKFWTTNATVATLSSGIWTGTGSTAVTLQDVAVKLTPAGFDQVTMRITNATFMVVSDVHGNMRLMPRFDNTKVATSLNTLTTQDLVNPAAEDPTGSHNQTLLLIKPTVYTYHVINKSGREAITWQDTYAADNTRYHTDGTYHPALPDFLKAYGAKNFRYLPLSEFDNEALTHGVYTLVNPKVASYDTFTTIGNTADIYVVYDVEASNIKAKGFDGSKMFNLKLRKDDTPTDEYLTYNTSSGNVGIAPSLSEEDKKDLDNIWRIEANALDPYDVGLYSFREADNPLGVNTLNNAPTTVINQTYQRFILTDWDAANNKFELLAVNSKDADNNYYAYLTFNGDDVQVYRNASRQHNNTPASNIVGFTLETVITSFTYKLYDLSGNLTLQGIVTDVESTTPSLPDFMQSPLVKEYYYFNDVDLTNPITSLTESDGTVYVSYLPYTPEEASLKLDGSEGYTLFGRDLPNNILAPRNGDNWVRKQDEIFFREIYYQWLLKARLVNGKYDPYDITITSAYDNRSWSNNLVEYQYTSTTTGSHNLSLQNKSNHRYMIVNGRTMEDGERYIEILQKKLDAKGYYPDCTNRYQYLYFNDEGRLYAGQGSSYQHGNDNMQFRFQPAYTYRVLNLKGKEVVSTIVGQLVKKNVTTPAIENVIKSPLVDNYHYYDVTAFDISSDGVFTIKSNAQELRYLSDATSSDIYVTYDKKDINTSIDLTGQIAYNMITGTPSSETRGSYTYYDEINKSIKGTNRFYRDGVYVTDPNPDAETQKTKPYLWRFIGGDPYDLTIQNGLYTDRYLYHGTGVNQYGSSLNIGTTNDEKLRTFILTGTIDQSGDEDDDFKFQVMAANVYTANSTWKAKFQYAGRNVTTNPHRNHAGLELWGFEFGWGDFVLGTAIVRVKLVPQNEGVMTYIVKNNSGTEAIRYKVAGTKGVQPEIPEAIKSPFAIKIRYWSDAACTIEEISTTDEHPIYITYEANTDALTAAGINLDGSEPYNVWVNGMYLYNSGSTLNAHATPTKFDDSYHEWYLEGNDPYDVKVKSKENNGYMGLATFDNTQSQTPLSTLISDSPSNDIQAFILMNGHPGHFELLAATKEKTDASTPSEIKNRLTYLGYNLGTGLLGVGADDANPVFQSGLRHVQVAIQEPLAGVTYHIMNLNGQQAVQYTTTGAKGDVLEVPEQIRSPFATNWQYWSDEACTTPLTTIPSANAHIYVTYTYNDNTQTQLQLDGQRFYNMQVADWYVHESENSLLPLTDDPLTDDEANVTANLWGLNGATGGQGIDPYNLRLVNKAYGDIYAGAVMDYADVTEDAMHLSNGEDGFRSAFFLVGSLGGPYEMVLASGKNITNNVLAYVNRHDEDNVHLTQNRAYQHDNVALPITFTSPVNQYLFKVYNRKGELAIQAWGSGVAGDAPEIPSVIKSPLVSRFYYDVETLPYSSGTDEIRVTYDVDDNADLVPNLLGTKFYNLKFRDSHFLSDVSRTLSLDQDKDHTNLPTTTPTAGNQYVWTPTALTSDEVIDPYDVTIKHSGDGDILYATTLNDGTNDLLLNTSGGPYQKFILLSGTEDKYQLMAATGSSLISTPGQNKFAYIGITNGNEPKLLIGQAHTQERTSIQVDLAPFQYTYTYVIVNNDMYEAIRNVAIQDGGDKVNLTPGLRSPLLDYKDYEFYRAEAFDEIGTYKKNTGVSNVFIYNDDATKAANKLTELPYSNLTIYVRYNYQKKAGGLDLTGLSKYQMMNPVGTTENYIYASTDTGNSGIWNNDNPATNHTQSYFLWKLNGNDPYNVSFTNVGHGNNDILTATVLWKNNKNTFDASSDYYVQNQGLSMRADNYSGDGYSGKYKANRFAILAHADGEYRLMAIAPFFWDPTYYDLSTEQQAVDKIANNQKQERYFTVDTRWAIYNHGRVNGNLEEMTTETGLQIFFQPTTTHNYRFHLTTKVDGRKLNVEKPKIMARDIFRLPEELKRKYCTYPNPKYYMNTKGSNNQDVWEPATKEDFVADDGAGIIVEREIDLTNAATALYPYFKYADDHQKDVDGSGNYTCWIDIYVDYQVIPHYNVTSIDPETGAVTVETEDDGKTPKVNPNGIPVNLMAWDKPSLNRLMNNEDGWTDAIFQINDYNALTDPIGSMSQYGIGRKDYLYFMVLKTNDDFSNTNGQYFLRRETNGRISYLNNDFRLHVKPEDNYKGWGYSRLAEYYRENDHAPFEEKHWLWAFAGDPYDFYVFNASSVIQETFNDLTGKTEVHTHRDHLVSYTTLTSSSGTTTELVVNTPDYTETAPHIMRWGLAPGQGAKSDETFSLVTGEFTPTGNADEYKNPTDPNADEKPLYWCMDKSTIDKANEVMLLPRDEDNTTLDYNIRLLPYEPHFYQDVRFLLKRDDYIDTSKSDDPNYTYNPNAYNTSYLTTYPQTAAGYVASEIAAGHIDAKDRATEIANKTQEMTRYIDNLPTGTVRMFSASDDREYAIGDVINVNDMPVELLRQFCEYTGYKDDYRTPGTFTVTKENCAYRGEVQRYTATDPEVIANPALVGRIIYNSQGKPMYNYWTYVLDGSGERILDPSDPNGTGYKTRGCPPLTIYVKYTVTTNKFLKTHPTKEKVAEMVANNDHVFFMDFADPNMMKGKVLGYNTGHHAYFDEDQTFEPQIGQLHETVMAEKMKWNGSQFVYDTDQKFNKCQFRTTDNRMESVPENLKWYFVGDPYALQVYCTEDEFNTEPVTINGEVKGIGTVASNLARFDPTESRFQFVVDCVHFRTPDESFIDERHELEYLNPDGTTTPVDNPNEGKPYYANFYWDVVPTTTDDKEAFALRFRADNHVLGYRDVFYYLAHDGIKRTYREAQSENPKAYNINLSYDEDNTRYLKGKYRGYHKANDENCAIRLTQPAKIYFSAWKETYTGEPMVKEELSEYFGVGETLTEVPRHLQRKFVKYGNLRYQKNNNEIWHTDRVFPVKLGNYGSDSGITDELVDGEVAAYNLELCTNPNVFVPITTDRASYKFSVTYTVDDITNPSETDPDKQIHLFTTRAEFSNPDVTPQWLDVKIGGNLNWLYYDKMNMDASGMENDQQRTSSYPTARAGDDQPNGWDIGIKGLHWAFIGDPYKFTIINRRRWEDEGSPRTAVDGSTFWLGTGYGQHNVQEDNGEGTKENLWYNYTQLGDTDENREYGRNGTGGNEDNGNTWWSLQMCKTGGTKDYFIRTASLKTTSPSTLVGDETNTNPNNKTNDYDRLVVKNFTNLDTSTDPQGSNFVLNTFSLETKTRDIQKADIRTAVAEDYDGADNDCFDANVRIYNTAGELKASLKHVEVTFGDVYKSLPKTLRRYGCNYIECYQISYPGFSPTELENDTQKAAKRTTINTRVQSLDNFTGDNRNGSLTRFNESTLKSDKIIIDENGRKYYEIAYVYEVDDEVAKYFTTEENASKEEYTWANADYQWDQIYKGSNVRVVTYENRFVRYEYNSDGHIVNEVYEMVERVTYKTGDNISTPAYGWVNTHDGSNKSYGDETTQTDEQNQKWAFVGDPYDFEMKNYDLFLSNTNTAMYYDDSTNGIVNTPTDKSHWAIVQGLQKTEVRDGKVVKATDSSGNPIYVYYLALIDDDETSPTYGSAINYVTFDRARDSKDLPMEDQYLYLHGAPLAGDPTGSFYDQDTRDVHPFYLAELKSYANMVIYHLVIAHQHSTDYINVSTDLGDDAVKQTAAKSTIRRHLAEYLHYKMNSTAFDEDYLTKDEGGFNYQQDDTYMVWDFKGGYQTDGKASGLSTEAETKMKQGTLRDLVNDGVPNYIQQRVGVGNALTVPWYMKRQFCNYKLYQRNVYRSETDTTKPVYEEADDEWIAAGKPTYPDDGDPTTTEYKVDFTSDYADPVTGRIQKTFVENGETKLAYDVNWVAVESGNKYWDQVNAQNGTEVKQLNESHAGRLVLIDVVYDVDPEEFRFADETKQDETTAWYTLMTNDEDDGQITYSYKDDVHVLRDRAAHYTNDNLWAPEGDPYGFVMHNRYATNNGGTAWDDLVITTSTVAENIAATRTTDGTFKSNKVVQTAVAPHNAVYEMLVGMNSYSFLMHPTATHIDPTQDDFESFYMKMDADAHAVKLTAETKAATVRNDRHANWRLFTTPEQLLPYFDRAGYVGALKPAVANSLDNSTLYTLLKSYLSGYRATPSIIDFKTMDQARKLVYAGTFSGTKFTSTNLVPIEQGYFRIRALSTEALDGDEAAVSGLRGARYVSGYRFLSESTQKNMTADSGPLPLHLLATMASEAAKKDALTTYEGLRAKVAALDAKATLSDPDGPKEKRVWAEHPAMRGNIELPIAEYDPSTIFHLEPVGDNFHLKTQDLSVNVVGESAILSQTTPTALTLSDIGGTVVTVRYGTGMTTGYLSIDPAHYYTLTVGASNELQETGDHFTKWDTDGLDYAVQTTKWLLQPVGTQQEWPYNEMPLRVKVNKGGNADNNYYASLYVPFDSRLNKTIDAAFTAVTRVAVDASLPTTIRLSSVSQLNGMGNPQFIPATWPVVIRTSKPVEKDGAKFVELYLPNPESATSTELTENKKKILLYGQYLEKKLAGNHENPAVDVVNNEIDKQIKERTGSAPSWTKARNVMVFGLPFTASSGDKTLADDNNSKKWYAYNQASSVGFYTNENWYRDHPEESQSGGTPITTAKEFKDLNANGLWAAQPLAHWVDARLAASTQRHNKYVYYNKAYYVYDYNPDSPVKPFFEALFDEDTLEQPEDEMPQTSSDIITGVYDLSGRLLRTREAVLNGTWRRNLPPGMYIVNGRKMTVRK